MVIAALPQEPFIVLFRSRSVVINLVAHYVLRLAHIQFWFAIPPFQAWDNASLQVRAERASARGLVYKMNTMMFSIMRKVRGCAASASVNAGIAMTVKTHEIHKSVHAVRSSLPGSRHAETKVGMPPRNSTIKLVTMPSTGSWKNSHSATPSTAPPRQSLSRRVHPGFPYFTARTATAAAHSSAAVIWLFSVCLASIPLNVTIFKIVQIIQVAFDGCASFRTIARMYGTNPATNTTPAASDKMCLRCTDALLSSLFL